MFLMIKKNRMNPLMEFCYGKKIDKFVIIIIFFYNLIQQKWSWWEICINWASVVVGPGD